METYRHLSCEDRDQIAVLLVAGHNNTSIARILGRSPSTISRELKRNSLQNGRYSTQIADGAYMHRRQRNAVIERDERLALFVRDRLGSMIEVIIPPPKNAVYSQNAALHPTIRDLNIGEIETHGRMVWQKSSGYNQRSRIETHIGRWKTVIGPKLKARNFENQKTEAKIGVRILNRMTELGRPNFERTA